MSKASSTEKVTRTSRTRPWESSRGDASSFGTWLRRQREVREITLREIADTTKIGIRYLEALERDEFEILPAPVFAKGFLRQYARFVGLDPDEAVNNYLDARQELEGVGEEAAQEEQPARPSGRGWLVAASTVAVIVVLLAVWWFLRPASSDSRGDAEGSAEPVAAILEGTASDSAAVAGAGGGPEPEPMPTAGAPAEPVTEPRPRVADGSELLAEAAPLVVIVDFSEDCWVEAEVDGERYIAELHVQGESLRIEARERVHFETLGNPRGVRLEVNGEPWPLPRVGDQTVLHDVAIVLGEAGPQIAPVAPVEGEE